MTGSVGQGSLPLLYYSRCFTQMDKFTFIFRSHPNLRQPLVKTTIPWVLRMILWVSDIYNQPVSNLTGSLGDNGEGKQMFATGEVDLSNMRVRPLQSCNRCFMVRLGVPEVISPFVIRSLTWVHREWFGMGKTRDPVPSRRWSGLQTRWIRANLNCPGKVEVLSVRLTIINVSQFTFGILSVSSFTEDHRVYPATLRPLYGLSFSFILFSHPLSPPFCFCSAVGLNLDPFPTPFPDPLEGVRRRASGPRTRD